jgi:uncharacterized membrane protein YbaN (DUF454 family)
MRALLIGCGTLCVALGVIGIFLPLMPTTVFLLMAAACYARSSDRFYQKLVNHRILGVYIRSSREGAGMKRRDKAITLVLLWVSIGATMIWTAKTGGCAPAAGDRHWRDGSRRQAPRVSARGRSGSDRTTA